MPLFVERPKPIRAYQFKGGAENVPEALLWVWEHLKADATWTPEVQLDAGNFIPEALVLHPRTRHDGRKWWHVRPNYWIVVLPLKDAVDGFQILSPEAFDETYMPSKEADIA